MVLVGLDKNRELFAHFTSVARDRETPIQIFASLKADSVCATWILMHLLKTENIEFMIHPVQSYNSITSQVQQWKDDDRLDELHTIIFINCGGNYDISYLFFGDHPPPGVSFYVADHTRPFALENVHSSETVYILDDKESRDQQDFPMPLTENEDDEGNDSDSSLSGFSEDEGPPRKKRRLRKAADPDAARKRTRKAEVQAHYKMSSFAGPTSHLFYELARDLKKDNNKSLWCAICGLTDMFINGRMSRDDYDLKLAHYQEEVLVKNPVIASSQAAQNRTMHDLTQRLPASDQQSFASVNVSGILNGTQALGGSANQSAAQSANQSIANISAIGGDVLANARRRGHIQSSKEFQFFCMRHWTLFDSLYHSSYVAAKLNVWRLHGERALMKLLVQWGIPLQEARQPYKNMMFNFEKKLLSRLENPDLLNALLGPGAIYESFTRQMADMSEVCAADVVRSICGTLNDDDFLELPKREQPMESSRFDDMPVTAAMAAIDPVDYEEALRKRCNENFTDSLVLISESESSYLKRGLDLAKHGQQNLVKMAIWLIEKNELHNTGVLRYGQIRQKNKFTNPVSLSRLAIFTLDACRERYPNRKVLPFLLCALCDVRDCFVVVGVPANKQMGAVSQNSFGTAFREAREAVDAKANHSGFETTVIEVQKDDLKRFIDEVHRQLLDE